MVLQFDQILLYGIVFAFKADVLAICGQDFDIFPVSRVRLPRIEYSTWRWISVKKKRELLSIVHIMIAISCALLLLKLDEVPEMLLQFLGNCIFTLRQSSSGDLLQQAGTKQSH